MPLSRLIKFKGFAVNILVLEFSDTLKQRGYILPIKCKIEKFKTIPCFYGAIRVGKANLKRIGNRVYADFVFNISTESKEQAIKILQKSFPDLSYYILAEKEDKVLKMDISEIVLTPTFRSNTSIKALGSNVIDITDRYTVH